MAHIGDKSATMIDVKVPLLGESISEASVARWIKNLGESVVQDEPIVELETDKVAVEVSAPKSGLLSEILAEEGKTVEVGAVLGRIDETKTDFMKSGKSEKGAKDVTLDTQLNPIVKADRSENSDEKVLSEMANDKSNREFSPAVRKMVGENNLDPSEIVGTGKKGRLLKEDVQNFIVSGLGTPLRGVQSAEESSAIVGTKPERPNAGREEAVRMTRLRKTIAQRLKDAQNNAAILTTFNEVDMTRLINARKRYKVAFEKKHGARLGFMTFFVQAAVLALKEVPAVNAEIDGDDLIYKNYYNIGVAVGTPNGLVVPVLKDADQTSFAGIELAIGDFGRRARDGRLAIDEMQGGTFTISNGGVYGSLLSTPILNPPQSGILGMHKIQDRPVVIEGEIVVRPMMYLALSYDHRIVDGREAVTFLIRLKECIEEPERLLLDV